MPPLSVFLAAWLVLAAAMAALWLVQRRTGNAAIVDVAWSFGTAFAGIAFAAAAGGAPVRRALVAGVALVWGARLGMHLLRRVAGEREDIRYRKMREEHGDRVQRFFFGFFQVQALWAILFAIPIAAAAANARLAPAPFDVLALGIAAVAIGGESLADRQLARFRANAAAPGRVCRDGLWKFSRHPNYFFEWIGWWAYVAFGFGGPAFPITLFGPALMLFFLLKVTGVPPTEARLLESRGDAYREYRRTTSAFFPWPPRA